MQPFDPKQLYRPKQILERVPVSKHTLLSMLADLPSAKPTRRCTLYSGADLNALFMPKPQLHVVASPHRHTA